MPGAKEFGDQAEAVFKLCMLKETDVPASFARGMHTNESKKK